MNIITIIIT